MKKIIPLLCCLLCVLGIQSTPAQEKAPDANGFPEAELAREAFDIYFSVPAGFRFLDKVEVLRVDTTALGMWYFSFESEDARCKLLWPITPMSFANDPGYSSKDIPRGWNSAFYDDELSHRNLMWAELTRAMQTDNIKLGDYVTVVAGKEARDRFNADSVFTFDIPRFVPITKEAPQFEHCMRMIISRNGRGKHMMMFLLLLTDEGKKNERDYIRKLDGRVWYGDDYETEELSPDASEERSLSMTRYIDALNRRGYLK